MRDREFGVCFFVLINTAEKDLDYVKLHTKLLEAAHAWIREGRKDSDLIRGESLSKAEDWLKDGEENVHIQSKKTGRKNPNPEPTEDQRNFITQSRLAENASLERDKLNREAKENADKTIRRGIKILALTVGGAIVAGGISIYFGNQAQQASHLKNEAETGTRLARESRDALAQFQESQTEGLLSAVRGASELKLMVKDGRPLDQYPTVTPIYTLQTILDQVKDIRVQGEMPKLHPSGKFMVTIDRQNNTLKVYDLQGGELGTLKMPESVSAIDQFQFSHSGEILVASFRKTPNTVIWRLPTSGQDFSNLRSQDLPGQGMVFDKAKEKFATYEKRGDIRIFNLSGAEIGKIPMNDLDIVNNSLAFSENGKFMAATLSVNTMRKSSKETFKVWDFAGNEIIAISDSVNKFLFSKDDQEIVTLEYDGSCSNIKIFNLASKTGIPLGSSCGSKSISTTPDHEKIIVTSGGSTNLDEKKEAFIKVYNWDGKELLTLKGHQATIHNEVIFSSDSQKIATSSYDGIIKVWDLNSQELFSTTGDTIEAEGGLDLSKITFNSSSDIVAVAARNGTTRLYNLKGQEVSRLKLLPRSNSLTFTPNGKQLLISDSTTTGIWNIDNQSSSLINPKQGTISQIKYSPDGKMLAIAGANESVQLWTLDGQKVTELSGYEPTFSPDSKKLAVARKNREVQIYSLEQNKFVSFNSHQDNMYKLKFNFKSNLLVIGSGDNAAIWDIVANPPKKIATINETGVTNLRFTSDDSRLLIEGWAGISIWHMDSHFITRMNDSAGNDPGNYKRSQQIHSTHNALFSSDGWTVAGNSTDGTLKLWSLNGHEKRQFQNHTPIDLRFSPDGKILASSVVGSEKGLVLWNESGQKINNIRSKKEILSGIEFSSDSQMIAARGYDTVSASSPTVLHVWDLSGRLISQFSSDAPATAISPDWKTVATIQKKVNETDQSVKIWKIRTLDNLIQSSCSKLKVFLFNQRDVTADRKMCGLE
jgi:WD40 repeat protein/ribosomal protein L22